MFQRLISLLAGLVLSTASLAQTPITVKAGEDRPFLISNGNGTYLYGSTGDEWDEGWMGLWVNRERVAGRIGARDLNQLHIRGGRDFEPKRKNLRAFSIATCEVRPQSIRWKWSDSEELKLWFRPSCDTVSWTASKSVVLTADSMWFKFVATEDSSETGLSDNLFSADSEVNEAVSWANAQLLNLLAEDASLLYAGIPWFNEGWGRDTFISLPGLLVTGRFDVAKRLILRFAEWLDRDPSSPTYGRIPNRVRPGEEVVYNTVDGTPWWMHSVYLYGVYSGDDALWDTLLSDSGAMRIALDAAILKSDSLGFLTHGDADTWMDAVGTTGPHTPRGNRAVEVQALHFAGFDNALRMTRKPNPQWREMADKIRRNFLAAYMAPSQDWFYDRLTVNGTPDTTMRPNQMFAFTVPLTPLVPPMLEANVTRMIASELFFEHGVLSLSPSDTCFHPFHQDWHYPKDDAYHQGIVWVWNSGPAKTLLIRQGRGDLALEMMEYEAWHMRERGMVGSLPELFDAVKRPENEFINWSGTASQAWSLAEFLRATYQDFLGIRPVIYGRDNPFWLFAPRMPEEWGRVQTSVTCGGTPLRVEMQQFRDSTVIDLQAVETPKYPLPVKFFSIDRGITGQINTTEPLHIVYRERDGYMLADGNPTAQLKLTGWPYDKGPKDIAFAPPIKKFDFASLRDPEWDVLTGKDVKCDIQNALLIERVSDPAGDDYGDGGYVYPTDENFETGFST
ncbi:MAG: hypothetical protein IPG71_01670 [bacterium]|nr:hypothetical protein [bacterium]